MQDRCITDMLLNNRTAIFSVFCFTLLCLGITRYYRKNIFFLFFENTSLEFHHFYSNDEAGVKVGRYLQEVLLLKEDSDSGYELGVISCMLELWSFLIRTDLLSAAKNKSESEQELNIQRDMVSFIYQHSPEKLSLTDIAAAGHVGRSKCCQIFKHYMQQSPVDFLNTYRLKISCRLLCTTQKSITEIAILCGFNHLSYFSKYFMECYGCTPREYRTLHEHETLLT